MARAGKGILVTVALGLGLVALALLLARSSGGPRGDGLLIHFLRLPGTGPEPSESSRAVGASLRGQPLPAGICLVRLEPELGLDWNGTRTRSIEVQSAPGALLEVVLESEGRVLARLHPAEGDWRVPLRLGGRWIGARPFRLTVRTREGELQPFETEIPGLLAAPAEWLEGLRGRGPEPGG